MSDMCPWCPYTRTKEFSGTSLHSRRVLAESSGCNWTVSAWGQSGRPASECKRPHCRRTVVLSGYFVNSLVPPPPPLSDTPKTALNPEPESSLRPVTSPCPPHHSPGPPEGWADPSYLSRAKPRPSQMTGTDSTSVATNCQALQHGWTTFSSNQ